jgi:hypothetical protein
MFQRFLLAACAFIARRLPFRHLEGSNGVYLSRYLLIDADSWKLFLHKFVRSDEDLELHNHPWDRAVSLILTGGYTEERRMRDTLVWTKVFRPGMLNFLKADTFHRVELLNEKDGCWTLFWVGKKTQSWNFWNRESNELTPWRAFLRRKSLSINLGYNAPRKDN